MLINNRQNGRRRGRGGPQVRNGAGGGTDRGNRIDNRARGNAAQLHEKYRNLARDAQTQGDRVMTEYYLQFADHYFRVLSENRARFEEQQPRRARDDEYDDGGDEGDAFDDRVGQPQRQEPRYEQQRAEPRYEQPQRGEPRYDQQRSEQPQRRAEQGEPRRAARDDQYRDDARRPARNDQYRADRADEAQVAEPAPVAQADEAAGAVQADAEAQRPRRGRRPRRDVEAASIERVDADRLTPPAFLSEGAGLAVAAEPAPAAEAEPEEAPRRRRTRRVKDDGDSVAA